MSNAAMMALMATVINTVIPKTATPMTPKAQPADPSPQSSPLAPRSTDLHDYLVHASIFLGVGTALSYEASLSHENYDPDIIGLLQMSELTELGMTKGDAMHLIAGCVAWNRKRKRENSIGNTTDTPSVKRATPATTTVVLVVPPPTAQQHYCLL
jgi:hypothetical protein